MRFLMHFALILAAPHKPSGPGLTFVAFGLLSTGFGTGFWWASRQRERANLRPVYVGYAKYWRSMLQLGALAIILGIILLAI